MKIKLPHVPYISRKISIDLLNSGFITFNSGVEQVSSVIEEILKNDVLMEKNLDERVKEILEKNSQDIDIMQIDRRNMFWLVKKRLAKESDFILNYDDRYSNISHIILEQIWKKGLVDYSVSENKIKNLIYQSIKNYLKIYESIEDEIIDKIDNLEKKVVVGSQEYDLLFEKMYENELKKRGMF